MILTCCALYLMLTALLGYAAISAVLGPGRRHWAEMLGLDFAAGCGLLPILLFCVSLTGIPPNRTTLIIIAAMTIAVIVVLQTKQRLLLPTSPAFMPKHWNAWTFLGFIALPVLIAAAGTVAVRSLTPGLPDVDAFAIWMFKAKVVAANPLRPIPTAFLNPSLSYSHQDYPLGFPLLVAGMYASVGGIVVQAGKAVLLPIYISLIAIAYAALRRMHRRGLALAITAVFAAAPVVVRYAGQAVADLPMVLFFMAAISCLWQWMEEGKRRHLLATGMFAAFAAFTKNEGLAVLPLLGLTAIVFAIARRNRRRIADVLMSAALMLVLLLPWLIYRLHLPRTHEDYGGKLTHASTLLQHLPRLADVLPTFVDRLIDVQDAGLLWLVLLVACIVGYRSFRHLPVLALWGLLLAHLGLYVLTFMVTPWNLNVLLPMVAPKLLMHATPAATLLIGLHLSSHRSHSLSDEQSN